MLTAQQGAGHLGKNKAASCPGDTPPSGGGGKADMAVVGDHLVRDCGCPQERLTIPGWGKDIGQRKHLKKVFQGVARVHQADM